ncbi:glycosyltransferase [Arenibaculum sp.]|uniref:glycosyltransferase n=1 Tax=Arenibaculum sp. TaxID=2865862 RepID=UPI0039C8AEB8
MLAHLDAALVRAGHRSLVVACAGSRVEGELLEVPRIEGVLDDKTRARAQESHRQAIAAALTTHRVDLVHLHGIDFDAYLPPPGVPALATLHLPPSWYAEGALRPGRPLTWLNCVSAAQHRTCPPGPALLEPIGNGVPVEALAARHAKRGYALCIGRICPEKGYHLALDAARRAGRPLLLAGRVYPYAEHEAYWAARIEPRLDRLRRFVGPAGFARKRRLLSGARCLVVPSLVPETSSLVAMEALACGTPVVAFPAGALAEIVEHGRTGFLVEDEAAMAEAIEASGGIDPETCRAAARERFSAGAMTRRYLDLYGRLA